MAAESDTWPSIPSRWTVRAIAIGVTVAIITVLTFLLPYGSSAAALLLDRQPQSIFPYPFTIQNLNYVALAWAMADLYVRWRAGRREAAFLKAKLLPEDAQTVLSLEDLGPIRKRIAGLHDAENGFLPYLMDVTILQLQASQSVDQALNILSNTMALLGDRVDLRYQMIRYLAWLIPTIGFIGTVIGLSLALELINPVSIDLGLVVKGLSVAFYTTLIALLSSALLAFVQHAVQEKEEIALNEAGLYCLKNLINKVYIPRDLSGGSA